MNTTQTPPVGQPNVQAAQIAALEARLKSASGWILAIALFSFVNTVLILAEADWQFLIGLFTTQLVILMTDHPALEWLKGAAMGINVVILGLFVVFGFFARNKQSWAFIAGMVFYALDTALLVWFGVTFDAMGEIVPNAIFHALALFNIWVGINAGLQLDKLNKEIARAAYLGQEPVQQHPYYQPPADPTNPNLPR